jgi:hypothetical protein
LPSLPKAVSTSTGIRPVRIQRQVVGRLVRGDGAVDVFQLERHAELLEDDVRDQAGVAGK